MRPDDLTPLPTDLFHAVPYSDSGFSDLARTPGGLFVPISMRRAELAPNLQDDPRHILRFTQTTIGWKSLTGNQATIEEVIQYLRRYSLSEIVGIVARITLALDDQRPDGGKGDTVQRQLFVLEHLLGPAVARRLVNLARADEALAFDAGRSVFFHERQTLNALKLAFLTVDASAPPTGAPAGGLVGPLLMLNDLIDPPEGTFQTATDTDGSAMELYIAANTLFNESPHVLHDFVRAHYLYIESHTGLPNAIDVPGALARSTGMDAETSWRALYALYAFWTTREAADINAGRIAVKRGAYLETLPLLPEELREKWFALTTWEVGDLQARIRQDFNLEHPRFFDVLPFEQRPLIAFDDVVLCASLPLLRRLPGASLQHRLLDGSVFDERERRRFLDTRGLLVERYTAELLARVFGSRFISEAELQRCAPEESVCDGIILYPDAMLLVECKTFSVRLEARHATDYGPYRDSWRRNIRKAADQFINTVRLVREGVFRRLGLLPEHARETYPVVGVFEQPIQPLTYRAIRRDDLGDHEITTLMASRVLRPIQFLHIREVELIELAAESGISVLDLFRAKVETEEAVELSLQHFSHLRDYPFLKRHSEWHNRRFSEISDAARDYFVSMGLKRGDSEE